MSIAFQSVCDCFESIRNSRGNEKVKVLGNFLLSNGVIGKNSVHGHLLYAVLRLFLPQVDHERIYHLKAIAIGKYLANAMGLSSDNQQYKVLVNPSDPSNAEHLRGDFGSTVEMVLKYRALVKESNWSVIEVNEMLDDLAQKKGKDNVASILSSWKTHLSARDHKWMVRIVIKELKIGLGVEKVLDSFHPDAKALYSCTNDLEKILTTLTDSKARIVPHVEPFMDITPMLAKRVAFETCVKDFHCQMFAMEPKLDGERILCHVRNGKLKLVSRNCKEYTDLYGPKIANYILAQIKPNLDLIVDGEMMVWDNVACGFDKFGTLKTVANEPTDTDRWLCYVIYDILYLGGEDANEYIQSVYPSGIEHITSLPLRLRRQLLEHVVVPFPNRVLLNEHVVVNYDDFDVNSDKDQQCHAVMMRYVDQWLSAGFEGAVGKDLNAHYMCGTSSRNTKKWIKLKPDYAGMTDDLDVLILGGYYGHGALRHGKISSFLVGVVAPGVDTTSDAIPIFYTLTRVSGGFNMEDLKNLRNQLSPYWQPWDANCIPPHFAQGTNGICSPPDFWISPKYSLLLEIYGHEITISSRNTSGYSLRFPRCKAIRYDKNWHECLTLPELTALSTSKMKRNASDLLPSKDGRGSKSRKIQHALIDVHHIDTKSTLFKGMEFCITQPSVEYPLATITTMAHEYGARIVANPMETTTCCLVAPKSLPNGTPSYTRRVKNLIALGTKDIVHLQWFLSCIDQQRRLPILASDYIYATPKTLDKISQSHDEYQDSYTEPLRLCSLVKILRNMTIESFPTNWQNHAMANLSIEEQNMFITDSTFLWSAIVYIINPGEDILYKLAKYKIQFYGGQVTNEITLSTTHILAADAAFVPLQYRHCKNIVNLKWLEDCIQGKSNLHPQAYRKTYCKTDGKVSQAV